MEGEDAVMSDSVHNFSSVDAETLARMTQVAREASGHAHAPYSKFHVGAAVLDEQGRIFGGCNVENASYGLTMCAERVAIGAAVAAGARKIAAVVVFTPTDTLTPPCGACRQVLNEFGPRMEVHMINNIEGHGTHRLDELLPAAFNLE
jgi:cytidine deaminase